MDYVVPLWPVPSLSVTGDSRRFPVRHIYCVGRNYSGHTQEMGGDPERDLPIFFMKPPDALVVDGSVVPYPPGTTNLHHEVELVVAIGAEGAGIELEQALDHVYGYGIGIDLTRRDLQDIAKDKRSPWEAGKSFAFSAPCGAIVPASRIGHPQSGHITLEVNDDVRQQGDLSEMTWSVPEVIEHLSRFFALRAGDLIFTGTPAGVGPVVPGDKVTASIEGLGSLHLTIGES